MDQSTQAERKLAYKIAELKPRGGPGRDKAYKEIAAGRLRAVKSGRSTLILVEDFVKYLQSLPAIQPHLERNTQPPLEHNTQQPLPQRRVRGKRESTRRTTCVVP